MLKKACGSQDLVSTNVCRFVMVSDYNVVFVI